MLDMMHRRAVLLGLPLALAGCAGVSVRASEEAVRGAVYRDPGPTMLSLITVKNEGNGDGAHTALLIAASERAMFDPYGGWTDPYVPERDDVLHGMTPTALERYLAYQAKDGYYYTRQDKAVSAQVAEAALGHAKGYGAVGMAQCTLAVSDVLMRLPGFEAIDRSLFPDRLQARFARLPGIVTTEVHGAPRDPGPAEAG